MGAHSRLQAGSAPPRSAISLESQLLAIGSGFVVFVVLSALFVAIQQRRKRRSSADSIGSPLIPTVALKPTYLKGERLGRQSVSPLASPSSGSSGSPQCTPLTPYRSFQDQDSVLVGSQHTDANNNCGSISLNINYDPVSSSLQLTILACHNLPNAFDNHGQCTLNPYVKLRVLPDNQHRVKTRVLRGTCNPFYDEQFTLYGVGADQLESYRLHLAVLSSDKYSRDVVLGEAFVTLNDVLATGEQLEKQNIEIPLYPRPHYGELKAEMLVSMAISPQTNSINVAILKMKDLPSSHGTGLIDPYAKIYLALDGQRIARQKTHVKKKSAEPVFNESFSFDVPSMLGNGHGQLRSAEDILNALSFEILVLNHDGVTRNEVVGRCLIGPRSQHWQTMAEQPGQQVAEWHKVLHAP